MSYTLTLPMPVSANRYWRTAARGRKVVTCLSKEALEFKRDVLRIAEAAGVTDPIRGRVHIDMKLYPHRPKDWLKRARVDPLTWDDTVQRIDLDNACKAVYDALKNVAFEDDKRVHRNTNEVMLPDGEERLVVTISPLGASPRFTPVQDLIDQLQRLDPSLIVVTKQTAQAVLF